MNKINNIPWGLRTEIFSSMHSIDKEKVHFDYPKIAK
jgi:hypothetical protein